MTDKKIYVIKTVSTHTLTYVIATDKNLSGPEVPNFSEVRKELDECINLVPELEQKWAGESILEISPPMDVDEYIQYHDRLFPHASDMESNDKLASIQDYDNIIFSKTLFDDTEIPY